MWDSTGIAPITSCFRAVLARQVMCNEMFINKLLSMKTNGAEVAYGLYKKRQVCTTQPVPQW